MEENILDKTTESQSFVSPGRELQRRFAQERQDQVDSETISQMLGITFQHMGETIVSDIAAMINENYRSALEGYILCLSRIVKHDTAWVCIEQAFSQANEPVPTKYYSQFGKSKDTPTKLKKGFKVE